MSSVLTASCAGFNLDDGECIHYRTSDVTRLAAVLVTNMPVPYRERVHEVVARQLDGYHVLYAVPREPNRQWHVEPGSYQHAFLRKAVLPYRDGYIYANLDIWSALDKLDPAVVITTGFSPTFLLAFAWARRRGRAHIPFTDGSLRSERDLSALHFALRRWVFGQSQAFVGASRHALDLYRHYGAPDTGLFRSYLCADNDRYARFVGAPAEFDVVFSGQLIPRKHPLFFADVLTLLKRRKPNLRALVLGDGPERARLLAALAANRVDHHYAGFVTQRELPAFYARARVMLFPTKKDPWGVVANEANAAGLPVITSPHAGAAGDLVLHGENGYVLDLKRELWAEHTWHLLSNEPLRRAMSRRGLARVREYNYDAAASGIVAAVRHCSR